MAWLVITTVGLIGFVAVLLTPGSGSPSELHHVALVPLFVAFGIFALGSLAFMAYFHLRPAPLRTAESERDRGRSRLNGLAADERRDARAGSAGRCWPT